jgi:hypothetical protein
LVFFNIVYTLSSTKLEIIAKQFLPGNQRVGEEWEGAGEGWRNDPDIVCT